tara:strand:- start:923 stop:1675 length:753 start_codon:yes stop_codon:yes gene_type:complete
VLLLFAFIFFDENDREEQFTVETANYIGEIFRGMYSEKDDEEIKNLITSSVRKYSNSDIFSKKNNSKLLRDHNGNITMKINYRDGSEDILDGEFQQYYESGKIKTEGAYRDNSWHGSIKEYAEDGTIISDTTVKNDIKEGIEILYHSNGKIKQKSTRVNGLTDGLVEVFDENGNKSLESFCVNGQETGKFIQYFESGIKKIVGEKVNGEFKGILKVFWDTGELQMEIDHDKNLMRTYTKDGLLHSEREYN